MDTGHALHAPSSMARTVQCARSATLSALYPELGVRPEAEEGTAAHWVWATEFNGEDVVLGQVALNGVVVNQEMLDSTQVFHEEVDRQLIALGASRDECEFHVEETLPAGPVLGPTNWGTPDLWVWIPRLRVLLVFDLKYGFRHVSAFECWQLLNYAHLISERMGWSGLDDQSITAHLTIIQPRSYRGSGPVDTWAFPLVELRGFVNRMAAAISRSNSQDPQATVNPECDYCPGRVACSANRLAAYRGMAVAQSVTPHDMSPEAMSREHEMLLEYEAVLKSRRTGIEEQLEHLLRAGQRIPGVSMESSKGADEWIVDAGVVISLGELLGKELAKPRAAITPAQARKAGVDPEVVKGMSRPKSGTLKLVRQTDQDLRKIFN